MRKILYITILCMLVLAACGGTKVVSSGSSGSPAPAGGTGGTADSGASGQDAMMDEFASAAEALESGEKMKCTFTSTVEGKVQEQVMWVKDKDTVRFDGDYQGDGEQLESHIIMAGEMVYMWTSDSSVGTKYSIADTQEMESSGQEVRTPTAMAEEYDDLPDVKVDCDSGASVPNSVFEPPEDVQFQDLAELMQMFGQ